MKQNEHLDDFVVFVFHSVKTFFHFDKKMELKWTNKNKNKIRIKISILSFETNDIERKKKSDSIRINLLIHHKNNFNQIFNVFCLFHSARKKFKFFSRSKKSDIYVIHHKIIFICDDF